jgi:predicted nuclease of restriction endonuclease-like (RecB) superfamily
MEKKDLVKTIEYVSLLTDIKERIIRGQNNAIMYANSELLMMYKDIGRLISAKQKKAGWGASVVSKVSIDIRTEFKDIKGFSERNLKLMVQFFNEYFNDTLIGQQPVAQLEILTTVIYKLPWGHNAILMQQVKPLDERLWYMQQAIYNGWSRNMLQNAIKGKAFKRNGSEVNNFETTLESNQSQLAKQTLKDPYIFDFLTLAEPFREKELESELIQHIERFLIELGAGFAFIGSQYHLEVEGNDYYIDLLFYHIKLRCFLVIDLKTGEFKPEYAGKMNFYCSVVDDFLKHNTDQPTIGLILCRDKNKIIAEYALRNINKPIGVSSYEFTRALPDKLRSSLPSIEDIENEFSNIPE